MFISRSASCVFVPPSLGGLTSGCLCPREKGMSYCDGISGPWLLPGQSTRYLPHLSELFVFRATKIRIHACSHAG
ncbi:hypothetical protein QL093DRAFT_2161590 [Fusarium oxysporum]|nr:hypothetical protein QL093DRAFT_2161590 [Fusarium oxysporum]